MTLPQGWRQLTVGDVAEINPRRLQEEPADAELVTFLPMRSVEEESGRIDVSETRAWSEVKKGYTRFQDGDVLFAKITPCMENGKSAVARGLFGGRGAGSTEFHVLRTRGEVSPDYLRYFLVQRDVRAAARMKMKGVAGQLRVPPEFIGTLLLNLPPLEQQQTIVCEIDKQFTRIENAVAALKRVQANLKRYRASVLKAACEGRLVPTEAELARQEGRSYETGEQLLQRILKERRAKWETDQLAKMLAAGKAIDGQAWKKRYRDPQPARTADLAVLPEGWTWCSVEQLSSKVVDGVHKKPDYVSSGIPFVTVKNLTYGSGIDTARLKYITPQDHAEFIKRANPERGDLLITKDGTLGVVRAIRTDETFSIFVSVAMIKPVLGSMTDYLEHALESPQVQVQMVPKGSGLQHIHLEDLRQDCVPLPPLDEQRRIVQAVGRALGETERVEREAQAQIARSQRLRQAILRDAFAGKLLGGVIDQ